MRNVLLFALIALASACTDRSAPPEPPAPREHPLAQDGSTARGITSMPDRVKVQLDLATVRAALGAYRAEHNGAPRSVEELSVTGLNYPADLSYDPATGTVTSQTYPSF
jgi:hypothetical protein